MAELGTAHPTLGALPRIRSALSLAERYALVRRASLWLTSSLTAEDATVQSMPDVSPTKWHLAHVTWFFETFVLSAYADGYRPFNPAFRSLFNSYYNLVGQPFPRSRRGLITRPGLGEVLRYRAYVDEHMLAFLARKEARLDGAIDGNIEGKIDGQIEPTDAHLRYVVEVGLNHEQQHQELLLMDIKHVLSANPTNPVYRTREGEAVSAGTSRPLAWIGHAGGEVEIGHGGEGFAYDNEGPAHRVLLQPFELATRLVTCEEWLAFMQDGGYHRPDLWLDDGWATVQAERWSAPLYWREVKERWRLFTLTGERALVADEPVCHMSYYEADAYARWAGARLPTEAEWECVAKDIFQSAVPSGHLQEDGRLHPMALSDSGGGNELQQMIGDLWEFTASPYTPYPGFRPPAGALGEYNGKFMVNQTVLRGGSFATASDHIRPTYRNFFHPSKRWQFGGVRLAR